MNFFFLVLYDVAIRVYHFGIWLAALFDKKARQWIDGRKDQFQKMDFTFRENEERAWFHCASLGEFEQGRPLMEAYRNRWPGHKIILTFFSPSGFEVMKNYASADYILYLPLDTKSNARQFISITKPKLAVFVKYEFWYHYLHTLSQHQIPVILISGIFRKDQLFFKWYGKPWLGVLKFFKRLFVQDEASQQLLRDIHIENITVAGDTRFDRVWQIAANPNPLPIVTSFKADAKLFVAGSTWPEDEKMLLSFLQQWPARWKLILVPHEISDVHITRLVENSKGAAIRYASATIQTAAACQIMIVDQMGLLSSLYHLADIAYIGGGFGKGIHNILEAAVYGIPVIFGPKYQKFKEAHDLLQRGGALSVNDEKEFAAAFHRFAEEQESTGAKNRQYVTEKKGATEIIMAYLQQLSSDTSASQG